MASREECAIDLENLNGIKSRYFLTDDVRLRGEKILRSTDVLFRNLLGKRKGDVVDVPNLVGPGSKLKVSLIMSKYTYAFQESISLLGSKYSDISGLVIGQF